MKKAFTLTIITGYFLMMSALGVAIANPGHSTKAAAKVSKDAVRREIIRSIACPAFITDANQNTDVRAVVEVDETGKVNVSAINSSSEKLRDYVQDQLKSMTLKNQGVAEKFVLIIHFVAG